MKLLILLPFIFACSSLERAGVYAVEAGLEKSVNESSVVGGLRTDILKNRARIEQNFEKMVDFEAEFNPKVADTKYQLKYIGKKLELIEKLLVKAVTKVEKEDGGEYYVHFKDLEFDPYLFSNTYLMRGQFQSLPPGSGQSRRHSWEYPAIR